MRLPQVPLGARHLRAYAELESYLVHFVEGRYRFLWVVGRPGVAKSESLKGAVRGRKVYLRTGGQLTPARFFTDCYHHRGQPIILDDAEHLLDNKVGAKLVSALGDTTPEKFMCYGTTGRFLGDVPETYYTTSSLCIIANCITAHAAIQSRAVVLYFDPTNLEIHRAVARWFWDQEIHDWFGRHCCRLPPLDARWYVIADADKRAGRDWRRIILTTRKLDRPSILVQDLETDPAYPTREDKARRFVESMANTKCASRATYFRLLHRLEVEQRLVVRPVPPIPLRRNRPPATPSLIELDSMAAAPPVAPDDEPHPLDVPAREQFEQPIRGDVSRDTPPRPVVLDDTVPWERLPEPDDSDE
jgi:hypothetical protein